MRLLLYRHGSTVWNEEHRYQGRSDIGLSPLGREEVSARVVPEEFSDWLWVSSPLLRARQTAELMKSRLNSQNQNADSQASHDRQSKTHFRKTLAVEDGSAIQIAEAWTEMNFGAWEGRKFLDVQAELPREVLANEGWTSLNFSAPGGGESALQVQDRVCSWVRDLFQKGQEKDHIVVTHKGVMTSLYALAVNWDMTARPPERVDFAKPVMLEVLPGNQLTWKLLSFSVRQRSS